MNAGVWAPRDLDTGWTHRFVGQLLVQLLVAVVLVLHFLALVVIVDGKLLQGLQHLLHLLFGSITVPLQPGQLLLQTLILLTAGQQQLGGRAA